MVRSDATGIVATVANFDTVGNWAVVQLVGNTMRVNIFSLFPSRNMDVAIASFCL